MLIIGGGIIITAIILATLELGVFYCGVLIYRAFVLFPIQASILMGFILAAIIFGVIKKRYGGNPRDACKALIKALKLTNKGKQ